MPHQWKESTVVPIYKNGDNADCSNYRGITLVSVSHGFYQTFLSLG
jgi:hypothetical protein